MSSEDLLFSRRAAVVGAGVATAAVAVTAGLVACGKSDDNDAKPTSAESKPGAVVGKTADVPVGSGKIFGDVVVTQANPGVFKAFTAVCTHQGCALSGVTDGKIDCPCHGSKFDLDGGVAKGPATKPLEAVQVAVKGDSIVRS